MKSFGKNLLNAMLIIAISGAVAAGVTAYVIKSNENCSISSVQEDGTFKQPLQTVMYNGVAAENTDFTYAADKTVHAVVHVKVTSTVTVRDRYIDPLEFFFGDGGGRQRRQQRTGSGSGVIISTDGYIITNNHVIDGADSIAVTLNDKRTFNAKVIGSDPRTDIALIKVDATDLQPVTFGDSETLKVGEWVLAVGNPFDLTSTVTAGIVSAKGRSIMTGESDTDKIMSFIQTDAAVNPGNSGGALVNTKGELVGINTAITSQTGTFIGYSFAVPVNMAAKVVSDIKQYGSVQRGMLGVNIGDPEFIKNTPQIKAYDPKIKQLEGAYITDFAERSAAKEAGLEKGDIIIGVNGKKVTSPSNLQEIISTFKPGDKVRVKVDRYGTEKEFTVELRNVQGNTEIMKGGDSADILGAAFKALSEKDKRQYGISYGIEVSSISKGKIQDCGIKKGFVIMIVNDEKIGTPEDFYSVVDKILKGNSPEQGLLIKGFYPNSGATRHYAIDLVD
ncbi:MAG: Do family serine endopeptidase [Tannerella sp.]|jgi:Do/DeqQ family serine protease|nr:Do family serine endopeptidase [Tannerella sp.]